MKLVKALQLCIPTDRRQILIILIKNTSDVAKFRNILASSKNVLILTGAGISAESGIPTFRGPESENLWRKFRGSSLDTKNAFRDDPALVWEFYHWRREVARNAKPNAAHIAITNFESKNRSTKTVSVITQNIDGLHTKAGTENLIELHGNLFWTRCVKCGDVRENRDSPICEAFRGREKSNDNTTVGDVPVDKLPHCKKNNCGGLLRPHVVWFGESLDPVLFEKADAAQSSCDVCMLIGTSSLVYPAAGFAPLVAARGAIVAEFNTQIEKGMETYAFYFEGPCCDTLPRVLE